MERPNEIIFQYVEKLVAGGVAFAFYRMPWTETPLMVIENGEGVEQMYCLKDLNGKKGFLIAPFRASEQHPIVLIHSDRVYADWTEIESLLSGYEFGSRRQPVCEWECTDEVVEDETALKEKYTAAFDRFIDEIDKGHFSKLVLSRKASSVFNREFSPLAIFWDACNNYPRMMISFSFTPQTGIWIGSSPEIIVSGNGNDWNTVALAGTMPIVDGQMPTEWSRKNQDEQAYVSDYIYKVLGGYSKDIRMKGPYTARAGQLAHRKTDFSFTLKDTSKVGELLFALHPTPAVCGLPKQEAFDFITGNEGYDRKYYSGIIGWLDPSGVTSLYVNLRCMNINGNVATFYAGGGILKSSELESEWQETKHKMNTMKACLL